MLMRKLGAAAATVVLVGGLAACGGGDDDESADTTTTEAPSDGGSDSETTITAVPDAFADEDCQALYEAAIGMANAFASAGTEEATIDFGALADALGGFADDAPDDVADDLEVLAEGYAAADEALGGEPVDFSDPTVFASEDFQAVGEIFGSEEFTNASDAVSEYFSAECGDFTPAG